MYYTYSGYVYRYVLDGDREELNMIRHELNQLRKFGSSGVVANASTGADTS